VYKYANMSCEYKVCNRLKWTKEADQGDALDWCNAQVPKRDTDLKLTDRCVSGKN
jgi:hypothetical protein